MALKLTQKKLLSLSEYEFLSNYSTVVNDKYTSSFFLIQFISSNSIKISNYMDFMNFLSTDRSFWPLSMTMIRTS